MLVMLGRVDLHLKVGKIGIGCAIVIVLVGLWATFDVFFTRLAAGEIRSAHRFLLIPLVDISLFSGFFWAAIYYRKKSEIHKRLILVATVALMGAPVGRITFLTSVIQILFVLFLPLIVGMIFDIVTRRRIPWVYIIGVITILASSVRIALRDSDAWINFSKWVYGLFF